MNKKITLRGDKYVVLFRNYYKFIKILQNKIPYYYKVFLEHFKTLDWYIKEAFINSYLVFNKYSHRLRVHQRGMALLSQNILGAPLKLRCLFPQICLKIRISSPNFRPTRPLKYSNHKLNTKLIIRGAFEK